MTQADVVVSSTAAPYPIIDVDTLRQVMANRGQQPLVLIDIAVPRDVVPEVAAVPGVRLFDVDALQNRVDSAVRERRRQIPRVEAIIAEEMEDLKTEFQELAVRPLIVDLRQRAEAIRQYELDRVRRFMPDMDADEWEHVERMSRALVNKLLHEPTVRLRAEAGNGRSAAYEETVRRLFGLEEEPS
jgi:glutamyl-tRNA reductase